jgi:hypothetical protein
LDPTPSTMGREFDRHHLPRWRPEPPLLPGRIAEPVEAPGARGRPTHPATVPSGSRAKEKYKELLTVLAVGGGGSGAAASAGASTVRAHAGRYAGRNLPGFTHPTVTNQTTRRLPRPPPVLARSRSFARRANLCRSTRLVNGPVGALNLRCLNGRCVLIVVLLDELSAFKVSAIAGLVRRARLVRGWPSCRCRAGGRPPAAHRAGLEMSYSKSSRPWLGRPTAPVASAVSEKRPSR